MTKAIRVTQATHDALMLLASPGEIPGDVVARLAGDALRGMTDQGSAVVGTDVSDRRHTERTSTVYAAARALVRRLDTVTTDEFARGAERVEREALRSALVRITVI